MSARKVIDRSSDAAFLRSAITALVRRFSLSERADVSCCGMTVAQAATLEILGVEGPMRLGALGRRLGITPSTLTRNLLRLEERGHVERVPDPEDGRAAIARLTPGGKRAAKEVERYDARFSRSIIEAIEPARRATVIESVDLLLDAVRRVTEECCPGAYDHLFEEKTNTAGESCCTPASRSGSRTGDRSRKR